MIKVGQIYYFKSAGSKGRIVSTDGAFVWIEWFEFDNTPCPATVAPYHINTFIKDKGNIERIYRDLPMTNPNQLFKRRN